MSLKLRGGAEAAFAIGWMVGTYDAEFGVTIYGAGRASWCVASYREQGGVLRSAELQLPNGEWLNLLHLIERCGFWSLPEDGAHLADPDDPVDGGPWLTVEGRDATRKHLVRRYVWWETGLNGVLAFGQRVSGFFVRHQESGKWLPRKNAPPQGSEAEPTAAPDPAGT